MPCVEEIVHPGFAFVVGLDIGKNWSILGVGGGVSVAYLRLGHFVIVVRERKVNATRVDVHLVAKDGGSHHRTFDVPTWSSFAPRRVPRRLSWL